MSQPPAISVIMPLFNGACWLPESLGSIGRQAIPGIELILVDDGSSDDSAAVARSLAPEALCVRQENQGPAAARNAGLARARGPLITFLDQDDGWPDGSLAVRVAALAANPAAELVMGRTRFVGPAAAPAPWVSPNLGAGLYRRRLFDRVGLLDPNRRLTDDVDWFLRIRESGLAYLTLPDITLHYRRDTGGVTHGRSWRDPELTDVLRASLARRRQAGGRAGELPLLSGSTGDPRAAGKVTGHERETPAD